MEPKQAQELVKKDLRLQTKGLGEQPVECSRICPVLSEFFVYIYIYIFKKLLCKVSIYQLLHFQIYVCTEAHRIKEARCSSHLQVEEKLFCSLGKTQGILREAGL